MIAINKAEKDAIVERFPNVHIVRTMKQDSRRHHYFCTEDKKVMQYLRRLRNPVKSNTVRKNGDRT